MKHNRNKAVPMLVICEVFGISKLDFNH